MSTSKKILTQKELVSAELMAIKGEITEGDRGDFLKENPKMAKSTLSRYLCGDVRDLDKGLAILSFCKARIAQRAKAVRKLTNA